MSLSSEERAVWSALQAHRGRDSAIKQADLAERVGFITGTGKPDTRRLQDVLKALTEEHGKPVVSACSKPFGVFVPEEDSEVDEYVGQLRSRATSCFKRIAALSRAAAVELHQEVQQELFEGESADYTRVRVTCACGCGESFEPERRNQVYKTPIHRWRAANDRRAS